MIPPSSAVSPTTKRRWRPSNGAWPGKASGASEDELDIDEAHQLSIVDFEGYSKVAYYPYEVLVNGNEVEALHMRFRMAVHFPDLSMAGEHGFTKLMSAPGATEDALEALLSE